MVSKMQDAMQEALDAKVDEYITEFPRLNEHVKDRIFQLLKTQSRVVVHHVEAILKAELAKPFTFKCSSKTSANWKKELSHLSIF